MNELAVEFRILLIFLIVTNIPLKLVWILFFNFQVHLPYIFSTTTSTPPACGYISDCVVQYMLLSSGMCECVFVGWSTSNTVKSHAFVGATHKRKSPHAILRLPSFSDRTDIFYNFAGRKYKERNMFLFIYHFLYLLLLFPNNS